MIPAEQILDAHCEAAGAVLPRDPQELRQWLLVLVERARDGRSSWAERTRQQGRCRTCGMHGCEMTLNGTTYRRCGRFEEVG